MTLLQFPARPHWPNRTAAREAALARRREEYAALLRSQDTASGGLLWAATGEPDAIPGYEATWPARVQRAALYARSNVPPEQLTEAELVTVKPPVQYECYERGAGDWRLSQRQVDWLIGAVLIFAIGWVGGVVSAVMVAEWVVL